MDALGDREHREVVFMKPVQCGGSELGRNWLGRQVDVDPGPIMIVFPSQQSAQETINERVRPMLEDSPRLRALLTGRAWDLKRSQLDLLSCSIYIGWAGSAQSLASRPIRFCLLDEIDKHPNNVGKEADPVSLAVDRTLTYGRRRKVYKVSTPTVPSGPIARAVDAAGDRRHYHLRCPECDVLILPDWDRVKFAAKSEYEEEDLREALALLESGDSGATLTCTECARELDQDAVWRGVVGGEWVSDGYEPGEHPPSEIVAFCLSGICSPWIGIDRLAIEWLRARLAGGVGPIQNFNNAFLGVPFGDVHGTSQEALRVRVERVFELSSEGHRRGVAPREARVVVAGVDTAAEGHQYVVRAFAVDGTYRSWLLDYGTTSSEAEMLRRVRRTWPVEGGSTLTTRRICVDSGGTDRRGKSRAPDIYRMAHRDPVHIWPIKGHGTRRQLATPVVTKRRSYHPPGESSRPWDVTLTMVDTTYFKDLLAGLLNDKDEQLFGVFRGAGKDYARQLAAERKVLVDRTVRLDGSVEPVWRWRVMVTGTPNHYWDAEVYALVAAYTLGVAEGQVETQGSDQEQSTTGYAARARSDSSWTIGRGDW